MPGFRSLYSGGHIRTGVSRTRRGSSCKRRVLTSGWSNSDAGKAKGRMEQPAHGSEFDSELRMTTEDRAGQRDSRGHRMLITNQPRLHVEDIATFAVPPSPVVPPSTE